MTALRYTYVLALTVWLGGMIVIGAVVAPATFHVLEQADPAGGRARAATVVGEVLHRFHLVSYVAGGALLALLVVMKLVGPRPVGFGIRVGIVSLMLASSLLSGMVVDVRIAGLRDSIRGAGRVAGADRATARRLRPAARPVDVSDGLRGARWPGPLLLGDPRVATRNRNMSHVITLIPGDGIGPEVAESVLRVLHVAGVAIDWDRQEAGITAFERYQTALPVELLDSVKRTKVALKGPVTTPIGEGFTSVNVGLRRALDLYANLRPVWSIPGIQSRFSGVDLVIVRENTEDLYAGLEHEVVPGVVESLKIITERASRRIAEFAFDYTRAHARKKVTAIHKANIMKLGDGLFLRTVREVARANVDVEFEERIVDAACMHLVMRPEVFDVLVLPNLYGDIVSDLCAGLVGGLGVVPGANFGHDAAVFEAVHGSAPDIAGTNLANPTALLLSALLMLEHLGEHDAASRIRQAVHGVLGAGGVRTRDLGGSASTTEYTSALCRALDAGA